MDRDTPKRKFATETNIGGQAMVICSVINAAGYKGQRGDMSMMILFLVIGLLSVTATYGHYFLSVNMRAYGLLR